MPCLWFSLHGLPPDEPAFSLDTVFRHLVPDQFKGALRGAGIGGISGDVSVFLSFFLSFFAVITAVNFPLFVKGPSGAS
jgi:hypothetical protein